jgi:hypothetical protein
MVGQWSADGWVMGGHWAGDERAISLRSLQNLGFYFFFKPIFKLEVSIRGKHLSGLKIKTPVKVRPKPQV